MEKVKPLLVSQLQFGDVVTNTTKGKGYIIGITKRTLTINWKDTNSKFTYKSGTTAAELGIFKACEPVV